MGQGAQAFIPKIIRLRMNGLVLLGCTLSVLVSVLITPSTRALSLNVDLTLEDGVISPLTRLLRDDNPRTNSRTPPAPVQKDASPSQASQSAPLPSRQVLRSREDANISQPLDAPSRPIEALKPFNEPLESIADIPTVAGVSTSRESSTTISATAKQSAAIVPLQATAEGWYIFGHVWYWWTFVTVGAATVVYVGMKYWRKRASDFVENAV